MISADVMISADERISADVTRSHMHVMITYRAIEPALCPGTDSYEGTATWKLVK